ncbi:hypothetical protein [Rhizobium leguminosarum]|uniref:hypothetical protein n=1 Tax=Rhizobium leguminosarum TaxID=384 RepID=UPI0010303C1A|nr:hypothetical protein [Rhizobium leguminosarum]TAV81577.1 hypothetical protein ELI22_34045 [Rhizobium leguminosarum]TAV94183.1 hypothetical protein ELI21_10440 [Rhizobium leguminosarum]TAW35258.1 hypothetical protein ELI23_10480 [Rhizobium leguminosarum]
MDRMRTTQAKEAKMAKRKSGEIGFSRVSISEDGVGAYQYESTKLPDLKEPLEAYFADRFLEVFNRTLPLGSDATIVVKQQNDTSTLDYDIESSVADFLELAEMTPLSQIWGRETFKTGHCDYYEFSKWVWHSIITEKSRKYGAVSKRTILLLYATHWQFNASPPMIELMRSTLRKNGCPFAAVFYVDVLDDASPAILDSIYPYKGELPPPRVHKGNTQHNADMSRAVFESGDKNVVFSVGPLKLGSD